MDTLTLRQEMRQGQTADARERMEESFESFKDMDVALNLARLHQMEGRWQDSIRAYNQALSILEEYEERAVYNIREMSGNVGLFTLAVGARGYFGAAYERSLLHTLNSLNYLMLGDMQGAAVELKRMEFRQELWLRESEERLRKAMEKTRNQCIEDPSFLPAGYSMKRYLADPEVQSLTNTYQDAFSYALSSLINDLAEDHQYAEVSRRRAADLNPWAEDLFFAENHAAPDAAPSSASGDSGLKEVYVITLTGLSPSLYIERLRAFVPLAGYVMLDFPSLRPPVRTLAPPLVIAGETELAAVSLLHVDSLAYRTLWDQMRYEMTAAFTRAALRTGISTAAWAAARSHKDTRPYSELIALATAAMLDIFSSSVFSENLRNWETLPNNGYITREFLPAGTELAVEVDGSRRSLVIPHEGKIVIVLVSYISRSNMRLDYAVW